ncbi:SRPBCC domain-containing protein [Nannocystaceae bacterium ST9]
MENSEDGSESKAEREFVITRVFDAPARLLFEAHAKPEHLMKWFGPKGYPLTLCEVDFRPGGGFRFAMTGPDGVQMLPFGGRYLEIVPNQKISFTNRFESPDAQEMIVTVTFEERAGRTTLTHHTLFASAAMKIEYLGLGFEQGTNSGFDQLAEIVEGRDYLDTTR